MALPTNNIQERAKVYNTILDESLTPALTSGILSAGAGRVQFMGGDEVKIPVLKVGGLGDYSRSGGYADTDIDFSYQTKRFRFDRSFRFGIDAMDEDETAGIANVSNALGVLTRKKEAPEVDSARYSTLYENINKLNGRVTHYTPGKADILSKLYADMGHIQNLVGETEQLYCFISGKAYSILTMSSELNKNLEAREVTTPGGITLKVTALDGMLLFPVPSERLKTEYAFYSVGGFGPKLFAGEMNWVIVGSGSAIAVEKHRRVKLISADASEQYDADQLMGRLVHDCWFFDEQIESCAVSLLESEAVDLAGLADDNKGITGLKTADIPTLTPGNNKVTIAKTQKNGQGIEWYYKNTASADTPDVPKVGTAFVSTMGDKLQKEAGEDITVTNTHYLVLYGVKDGRIVVFDSKAAGA